MIKIIGIKCKDKYYVSEYREGSYHRYNKLNEYIINGVIPEDSFHSDWSIIDNIPKTIQKEQSQPSINHRYELKDNSFISEKIPKILKKEDCTYVDEDGDIFWTEKYRDYQSLYDYTYDAQPNILVNVEFEYNQIMEIENIDEYNIIGYGINQDDINYQLIDRIIFPNILLPSKACSLTSEQSYKIVRDYVKRNINPEYAEITSDYDFCFTVKKRIVLSEPEEYSVDVNNSWFRKTRRKPKYEKRYRTHRQVEIFNMAPKPYNNYKVIQGFRGNDNNDLKENIDGYLKDLIEYINEPLKECQHCKGEGVIIRVKD